MWQLKHLLWIILHFHLRFPRTDTRQEQQHRLLVGALTEPFTPPPVLHQEEEPLGRAKSSRGNPSEEQPTLRAHTVQSNSKAGGWEYRKYLSLHSSVPPLGFLCKSTDIFNTISFRIIIAIRCTLVYDQIHGRFLVFFLPVWYYLHMYAVTCAFFYTFCCLKCTKMFEAVNIFLEFFGKGFVRPCLFCHLGVCS